MEIHWHTDAADDIEDVAPALRPALLRGIRHKLSTDPTAIGRPLKGTANQLWKIKFTDYRIIYTIKGNEVWILAVSKRETDYSNRMMSRYSKAAIDIHSIIRRRPSQ